MGARRIASSRIRVGEVAVGRVVPICTGTSAADALMRMLSGAQKQGNDQTHRSSAAERSTVSITLGAVAASPLMVDSMRDTLVCIERNLTL